jgi:hypothetical protein
MKNIGKMIMVVGFVLLVATSIYIVTEENMLTSSYPYPGLPVGIGGTIKYLNGTDAPDDILVTAKNIDTGREGYSITENGWYAIGIDARDSDKIVVSAEHNGMTATNSTTVDVYRVTQWCNLTFGIGIEKEKNLWWLLLIPIGVIAFGGVVDIYEREKKWKK